MMRTFKTTKGTELPLLNLRGKEYLEVKYRIVWFREDHPDWSIETELVSVTDVSAYAKATVRDDQGRVIATSHKFESVQGFPDFIEKAETGSIGRALALIGYGTQFCADELDEGKRVVDSPVEPKAKPQANQQRPATKSAAPKASIPDAFKNDDLGEYICPIGQDYKGLKLKDIDQFKLDGFLKYLDRKSKENREPLKGKSLEFYKIADAYLKTKEFGKEPSFNSGEDVPF